MIKLIFIISFITLTSCNEESNNFRDYKYLSVDMKSSNMETSLPKKLWDEIDKVYQHYELTGQYTDTDRGKNEERISKNILNISIFLREKTEKSLGGNNLRLELGNSGSLIDFKDILKDAKIGSFYFNLEMNPFPGNVEEGRWKVFHISGSKKLRIAGQVYGKGCNYFRDVTSFFNKAVHGEGFLVSSKDARHISLLSGTFVFVSSYKGVLYFSHLNVKDSRYEKFQCDRLFK